MLYFTELWIRDIDEVLSILPELSELEESTVMITGAGGLVCSAIVDILIRYNEIHDKKIYIIAAGRSYNKIKTRFLPYFEKEYFRYIEYDATCICNMLDFHCDYMIHGAGNAFPERITKEPVETMMSNVIGIKGLLDCAKENGTKRILYISSSEVYGKKAGCEPYNEREYGYIDILNSRNSYSIGKRASETLCSSYADEYGVESVIVRPGHVYGPTALQDDNRVSSAWAFAAARGEDIVLKSNGKQIRSYCYCLDCASAILKVLLKGENTSAYNISNPDSVLSIKEMAEILVCAAGVKLIHKEPTLYEMKGFNPMSNSVLDSTALQKLGWKGIFDAKRGFSHTIKILQEMFKEIE